MGELKGLLLKYDPDDPAQGVFVVSEATREAVRVEVAAQVLPASVIFQVPDGLAPGAYRMEVRARFGPDLRTGRLQAGLRVEAAPDAGPSSDGPFSPDE